MRSAVMMRNRLPRPSSLSFTLEESSARVIAETKSAHTQAVSRRDMVLLRGECECRPDKHQKPSSDLSPVPGQQMSAGSNCGVKFMLLPSAWADNAGYHDRPRTTGRAVNSGKPR